MAPSLGTKKSKKYLTNFCDGTKMCTLCFVKGFRQCLQKGDILTSLNYLHPCPKKSTLISSTQDSYWMLSFGKLAYGEVLRIIRNIKT